MKIVDCSIQQSDSAATAAKAIVRLVIADNPDPAAQPEHIILQAEIDVPAGQKLALLQSRVVTQAREILARLDENLQKLARS
jgi:hypothetical protein